MERRAPSGKRGAESSGRRWCQDWQERAKQSDSARSTSSESKRGQPVWIRELSTAVSTACQQTMSTQVQNATSTTTHEELMKRADRLFKLRSYLGAMDQRNELEPATTEESSTTRLNRALSTQMYSILVMMKTLYRCRNASVSEEFAGRRQFVREWEPRFVGLLSNVLSCSERRRSEKVFLLQKGRSCEVPEQDEIEGRGRCRGETSDCKHPTEQHSSGCAAERTT